MDSSVSSLASEGKRRKKSNLADVFEYDPARLMVPGRAALFFSVALATALASGPALGLDKQGSAHGGDPEGSDTGVDLTGALSVGVSLYNPSYAARPNNTGLTLMRYAAHADVDLVGRRLSIPLDLNMFTDRLRDGVAKFAPSEADVIAGITSTWRCGPGALELGARYENDRQLGRQPADQPPPTPNPTSQQYIDVRARYLYSFADASSRFHERFPRSDVSGWLTLGWFAYNPSYYARPDNTGLALFRYAVHTELSLLNDLISVGLDATSLPIGRPRTHCVPRSWISRRSSSFIKPPTRFISLLRWTRPSTRAASPRSTSICLESGVSTCSAEPRLHRSSGGTRSRRPNEITPLARAPAGGPA